MTEADARKRVARELPVTVGQGVALATQIALYGVQLGVGGAELGVPPALTDDEEKGWAKAVDNIAKLAKGKESKRVIKAIERGAPWLAFGWTAFLLFGPRAAMTMQLVKERREKAEADKRAAASAREGA